MEFKAQNELLLQESEELILSLQLTGQQLFLL